MNIYIKYSIPIGGFRVDKKRSLKEAEESMAKVIEDCKRLGVKDNGQILVQ